MGLFDQWGGVKAPPPPSLDDYTAQQMAMKQQAAMNQMMNAAQTTMAVPQMHKDPSQLTFTLREISNGYMVKVGDSETYVKDLNDVGGVIAARWAAKILGE